MATQSPQIAAAVQAAVGAIESTAAKNTNNIASKSVDDAKPELTAAITKAIAADPKVQFSTNTELFWKKRSFWGAVGSGFSLVFAVAAAGIAYMESHTGTGAPAVSMMSAAMALWGGYSSWRAGRSTTPLWTTPSPTNPVTYRG